MFEPNFIAIRPTVVETSHSEPQTINHMTLWCCRKSQKIVKVNRILWGPWTSCPKLGDRPTSTHGHGRRGEPFVASTAVFLRQIQPRSSFKQWKRFIFGPQQSNKNTTRDLEGLFSNYVKGERISSSEICPNICSVLSLRSPYLS